ncbi:integrase core domain-containing protein [Hirsutella rhossiliensis]
MRCLDNWNAELRSCGPFTILTDHRNLEYFATRKNPRKRQSGGAANLPQFDFKLEYRRGSGAVVPDALSRREQDKPQGIDDEREQGRMIQLIPDSAIPSSTRACINAMSSDCSEASTLPKMKVFEVADLQQLWDETVAKDSIFRAAYKAVRDRERAFPPSLGLKIQISECTLAIVARRFYWPGQSQLVRRRRGFLKPLPIPDRPRSHLSMDFITDLPPTGPSKARYLWVIVDRLTKAVTLEVMDNMEAEPCANRFLQCHYRFHGMPRSIVSDRGSNWLTTKISPFFSEHGYHVDPISVEESEEPPRHREESRADSLLSRLQEVNEYMQAVMASSQQQQEEAANAKRQPAERFEVGDKVWLSMANYRSPRPCKKLDWLHHKYTVTKVISSHVVELDVRGSIYPRFHVDLCGGRIKIRLLAKGTIAMKAFEDKYGPIKTNDGPREGTRRWQERKNPADADLVGGDKG